MKGAITHQRNAVILFAFAAVSVFASIAVARLPMPEQLLMLLLAPVLLAALLRHRYVYVTMLTFMSTCAIIATENYRWPITDSTRTILATLFTAIVACEAIRYNARRQRRLLRRAAESEQRLRTVLDNARDAIFTIDERGRIVDVNESVIDTLGHTREALLGSEFTCLFTSDAPPFLFNTETNWSGNLLRANGQSVPVEISVGHARHGRGTAHIAVVRDHEARDRAEAQIRRAEAIRKSILESTPDHVIMVDLDYRIQFINRTVPDLTVEGVTGENILTLVPPDRVDDVRQVYETVRKTKKPASFYTEYTSTIDGEVTHFESRLAPVIEDGEVAGFIVSASDVSERKRQEAERLSLERRALQSQKLESLGLLAGGVAHDFNNLLVAIMGRADLARADVHDSARMDEHLQQIIEASAHAAGLCQQLLAYSGKGKFAIAPTAIARVIAESQKLIELSLPENIRVVYELAATPCRVEADSTQLKQVLMNLVSNAAAAMQPGGGTIHIRTGAQHLHESARLAHINGENITDGDFAYLEVADAGAGMSHQTMERLFDPFFTTKTEGTGLGMAAVLGIVRGHRGAMSVVSNEGEGTTIRVLLPATAKPEQETPDKPASEPASHTNGGLVLVVDDEPTVRNIAARILERADFDVIAVDSGACAVETVADRGPEVAAVLLDMKMPDMNGEEVMECLRALQPDLPILLSSGYSETEVTQRAQGKGVSAVLPKPYRAQDLVDAINDIVLAARHQ